MHELAILVVLYSCQPGESQTLRSLAAASAALQGRNVRVCIWNNGPVKLLGLGVFAHKLSKELRVSVAYAETPGNAPLSSIYNFFLSSVGAKGYLFLDHDSTLSSDFMKHVLSQEDADFLVPRILVDGKTHGPVLNRAVVKSDLQFDLAPGDSFVSIGSGLTLYNSGLRKLKRHQPDIFDENFALYGVDSSFWLRVLAAARDEHFTIACCFSLVHSLSRLEDEAPEVVRFRQRERGYDNGITLRRYPSAERFRFFVKIIIKRLLSRNLSNSFPSVLAALHGLITGKHPRCGSILFRITWHEQESGAE